MYGAGVNIIIIIIITITVIVDIWMNIMNPCYHYECCAMKVNFEDSDVDMGHIASINNIHYLKGD